MLKRSKLVFTAVFCLFIILCSVQLTALSIGQEISSIQLLDANDAPKAIPYVGTKVITLFYTDPDVKDINDPLSNAIKAKKYPKEKIRE